jgi:hypothetical protein
MVTIMKKKTYVSGGVALAMVMAAIVTTVPHAQELPPRAINSQTWGQLRTAAPSLWAEPIIDANGRQNFRLVSWFVAIPVDNLGSNLGDAMQAYNRGGLPDTRPSTLRTGAIELSSRLVDFHGGPAELSAATAQLGRSTAATRVVALLPTDHWVTDH